MATIKAIERQTVHQIQSGQVIVDLCSVVKELVENSLDAGATSIDVRFKNQGLDAIEVQDNGSGVSKNNYETLALKHYTSKLATYSDLTTLETFGFRGEALSSLCALSTFTVTTCLAEDVPKGSKLEYEISGKLRSTGVVAAQKGTLISVEHLFRNLPVRRRELERNIKREWNRVIGVLNQYACIQTGVKFSVSQQPTKGKRVTLFSTKGNKTTRDNIVNVFGAKTLTVLIPLDLKLELEPTKVPLHLRSITETPTTTEIQVRGHVSRPAHGEGRQTPDRQMFFVNGRPCGLPQFAKVFNEVYKAYNASQSPFIFADIQLDTHLYDVNVSPDKRTILLHDQPRMLDNLREALVELFEAQDYAVPTSSLALNKQTPYKKPSVTRETPVSTFRYRHNQDGTDGAIEAEVDKPGQDDDEGESEGDRQVATPSLRGSRGPPDAGRGLTSISQWMRRGSDASVEDSPRAASAQKVTAEKNHNERKPMDVEDLALQDEDKDEEIQEKTKGLSQEDIYDATPRRTNTRNATSSPQRQESPIPSITAPTHEAGIHTIDFIPASKWKRPAPEMATITIGDQTVTSMLGGPSSKRSKTMAATTSPSIPTRTKPVKKTVPAVPSFQGRLTQMFAASSRRSQDVALATSGSDREEEDDEEEEGEGDQEVSDAESEQLFVRDKDEQEAELRSRLEEQENHDEDEEMAEDQEMTNLIDESPSPGRPAEDKVTVAAEPQLEEDPCKDDSEEEEDPASEEENDEQDSEYGQDERDPVEEAENKIPSEEITKRAQKLMKGFVKKQTIHQLQQTVRTDESTLRKMLDISLSATGASTSSPSFSPLPAADNLDAEDAEAKLSLTISKVDFLNMKIIGQFNLGFIIAVRQANTDKPAKTSSLHEDDELFIIDQHATDEKYNFERLQSSTVVQSQRLVSPKQLDLTALEEEIIKENIPALEANGFQVSIDESGFHPVGQRVQLLSLPLSRETTFTLADLEELVSLLTDHGETSATTSSGLIGGSNSNIPRPSKVRKMFAMRACRSSVMIGKGLNTKQMEKLVRHMGELDKPWNCPHGRPTMRHLCGLKGWDGLGWREGDEGFGVDGELGRGRTDWAAYLKS